MKALMVYGYNPKEKSETGMTKIRCLFQNLYPSPGCIANAKRTAQDNGYVITKVELNASFKKAFKDVTDQFMKGRIEE